MGLPADPTGVSRRNVDVVRSRAVRWWWTVAIAVGVVAAPATARAARVPVVPTVFDNGIVECFEPAPAATGVPPASTPLVGAPAIALDVLLLLDGVNDLTVRNVVPVAAATYEPLGIALRVVGTRPVAFKGRTADELLDQAKAVVGGRRPGGVDIVMLVTGKNIIGSGEGTVGVADCIGGVRFAERAFAVTEVFGRSEDTGRTMAHEIGHLLGAHHHYANCVEGNASALNELTPCTLMFNYVNYASREFSQLNGGVVRGYAEEFAAP